MPGSASVVGQGVSPARVGLERVGIVAAVLLLVALPTALHGWPTTPRGHLFTALLLAGGLALLWWRSCPGPAAASSLGLLLAALAVDGWFPDTALPLYSFAFAVIALGWSGRAAWLVGLAGAAYLVVVLRLGDPGGGVATLMFTVPPYIAGTVLRLRRQTAHELALRLTELEEEQERFAEIALRHERVRIASELHDIVGHAISVMVVQAAAGQRLVDTDPERARATLAAISESARRGSKDLERLIELLAGSEGVEVGGPDLTLVEEVVSRASRTGLDVTCRFEGDRDGVAAPVAQLAFRVVQESLTNALRYAPGAKVAIVLSVDGSGRGLCVRVENGRADQPGAFLTGTGRGLLGLRERAHGLGGRLRAGPTDAGGWLVEAHLPGGQTVHDRSAPDGAGVRMPPVAPEPAAS